jgi:hypothetical protein
MAKKTLRFPIVKPRWYQLPFWKRFDMGAQFNIISWPRRAGKDLTTFSLVVNAALKKAGNYYYYFPTGAWAQRALWDNICEWADGKRLVDLLCPPEVVVRKNNTEYFLDLINGSRIKLGGTDNLDFVGQGGAGYVLSEYSLHKGDVTSYLMPILDQSNAWLIANGTMRGRNNHLYRLYENNNDREGWFTQWYTLEDTKTNYWINEEEDILINPELIGRIDPETGKMFKNVQEYVDSGAISFIKAKQEFLNLADSEVEGGYYGYELKCLDRRRGVRSIDPFSDIVYTFWDLGGKNEENDSTTIVFAHVDQLAKKCRVVDYYEVKGGKRSEHWAYVLNKGYNYGGHYYPHDGKRVSNNWDGESASESAMKNIGVEIRFIPKSNNTLNDIEIVRRGFSGTEFSNSSNVEVLREHLRNYHEKTTTGKPCHTNNCSECHGASHGADCFRYLQIAIHENMVEPYLLDARVDNYYKANTSTDDYIIDDGMVL